MPPAPSTRTPLWQGMPPAAPASQSPIEPIVPPVGATRNPYAPKSETVPVMERPDMKPMNAAEAHRYAHAQATEAELPGSPAGTSKGAHDWLSTQAKVKYGVKSWHELTPTQMQTIGDDLLDANRAKATSIPPVK